MKLIVGLGNQGFRYRRTRHNVGFMALDRIARMRRRFGADVLLLKPSTYMNLSGPVVAKAVKREEVRLSDLLVIADDADLPLGSIRLRRSGSSGGHKGLGSIIDKLGTTAFPRLRIGIASTSRGRELADYVLRPFKRSERRYLDETLEKCSLCVESWIKEGIEAAMNKFNSCL